MNREEIARIVRRVLAEIAPDADLDALSPDDDLRDAIDLDSMDHLNFVVGVGEATGIDVPERDYTKLVTINDAIGYLADRVS